MRYSNLPWQQIAAIVGAAAGISYSIGFVVRRWLLRFQIVDWPNERSNHSTPMPRGGGLGIVAVICAGAAVMFFKTHDWIAVTAVLGSMALATVSFLDDRRPIPWRIRLSAQVIAATAAVIAISVSGHRYETLPATAAAIILIFGITGYANAYNFMDGINGIATVQAVLAGMGTALVALAAGVETNHPATVLSLLISGAAAGFLPHNYPRARMFMGDVGSVPLGFLLAVLAVWIAHDRDWWLLLSMLSLHANFALDTAITLLRRWRQGAVLYEAHREHFYQRLVRSGFSHAAVTGWESGLQVLMVALAVVTARCGAIAKVGALVATTAIWLTFFSVCEREFQRKVNVVG